MFHAPSIYALPVCRLTRCLLVSLAMATPFYAVHLLIEDYKCLVTIAFIKILYFFIITEGTTKPVSHGHSLLCRKINDR